MKLAMTSAASALVRSLIARSELPRNRILLTAVDSVEWRSLTFNGERHRVELRVIGLDSRSAAERICAGLEDAEFEIPGLVVADIAVIESRTTANEESAQLTIEALTIEAD